MNLMVICVYIEIDCVSVRYYCYALIHHFDVYSKIFLDKKKLFGILNCLFSLLYWNYTYGILIENFATVIDAMLQSYSF